MREEIEDCLPPELNIEKTLILAQFFLINAARGAEIEDKGIPKKIIFEEYNLDQPYGKPVTDNFSPSSAFRTAFNGLAHSYSGSIKKLIRGFFLLKSNVIDYDRLSEARYEVADDLQTHVDAALAIDAADMPSAYKIGTTRNSADKKLSSLLESVSDYAAELDRLSVEEDASHIQEAMEPIEKWYDSKHTIDDLAEWFKKLYKCAGVLDVTMKSSYDEVYSMLNDSPEDVSLTGFREDIESFQNIDERGVGLIARLHDFARSQHQQDAWEIYEAFDSLISDLQEQDHKSSAEVESLIKELEQYSNYEEKRQNVLSTVEGL
jgi:hypothetical protein